MYLNRPKSSRLLSRGNASEKENGKRNGDVTETSTTSIAGLGYNIKFLVATKEIILGRRSSRASSARRNGERDKEVKLPSLAQVNRDIMDKSAELVGKTGLTPQFLVDWISDKRGNSRMFTIKQFTYLFLDITPFLVVNIKMTIFFLKSDGITPH